MNHFRKMKPEDIPSGLQLCRAAGWNQVPHDWDLFVNRKPQSAWVATDESGRITGTVTVVNYEDRFSWIGMVLVDPAVRRQGTGTFLLNQALAIAENVPSVKLDATPAGREVYLKLGFQDEYVLSRMHCEKPNPVKEDLINVRQIKENDFETILQVDREVFGADRNEILQWYYKSAPGLAHMLINGDRPAAYCFGRHGHHFSSVGPVVANNAREAITLLSAALRNCNRPVILDTSHNHSEFMQWLTAAGFAEQRKLTRMYRGSNDWPGLPARQFTILGPELG